MTVARLGYAATGQTSVHPLDEQLQLPKRCFSYPLQERLVRHSVQGPFDEAVANVKHDTGVPLSKLKFVAVASGDATPLVLDDTHYQAQFGVPNPNLALIAALKKVGVTIAVCGQAVAEHHFEYDWVDSSVTLSLSALTTVTTLQQAGYVLMPL